MIIIKVNGKKFASISTLIISIILVIIFYPKLKNPIAFRMFLANWGLIGIFLDLLIVSLQMLIPVVPFALLAGANIILYGWFLGYIISLVGSLIGSLVAFWLARVLGQEWKRPEISQFENLLKRLSDRSFILVFTARLIPVLPASVVNYGAGLSKMTFLTFFMASLLGKLPMIAWESWLGYDFWHIASHPKRFVVVLLLTLIVVVCAIQLNKGLNKPFSDKVNDLNQ